MDLEQEQPSNPLTNARSPWPLRITAGVTLGSLLFLHFPHLVPVAAAFVCGLLFGALVVEQPVKRRLMALAENPESIQSTGCPGIDAAISRHAERTAELARSAATLQLELDDVLERYELLTTNIAAAILVRDNEGRTVFCSPYTEVLTGYSLDEIYDSTIDFLSGIVADEDRERYERALRVSAIGEDIVVRYQIRHKSGIYIWLETRMVPVCGDDGEVLSTMTVSIDVTQMVTHQRQVEEQNRDLSDFAYMVSHDLKAPIFTIKGMASALTEDFGPLLKGEGEQLLGYILDASKRLEQLIASVIEYSSISTKTAPDADVALDEVLQNVVQDLSEQIKQAGAEIITNGQLPVVRGAKVRMYQVFSNLVGNSIKYRAERPLKVIISAHEGQANSAVIEVTDNGLGIPEDKIDDIFRPYHRAHVGVAEGSGIGLACVKKIVERVGGRVWVRSKPGEGSSFFVSLPLGGVASAGSLPKDMERIFN